MKKQIFAVYWPAESVVDWWGEAEDREAAIDASLRDCGYTPETYDGWTDAMEHMIVQEITRAQIAALDAIGDGADPAVWSILFPERRLS